MKGLIYWFRLSLALYFCRQVDDDPTIFLENKAFSPKPRDEPQTIEKAQRAASQSRKNSCDDDEIYDLKFQRRWYELSSMQSSIGYIGCQCNAAGYDSCREAFRIMLLRHAFELVSGIQAASIAASISNAVSMLSKIPTYQYTEVACNLSDNTRA